jgi:hypothetical protein
MMPLYKNDIIFASRKRKKEKNVARKKKKMGLDYK